MGTFGSFTDSSTPVATTIQSGTLNIDVTQQGFAVPVTTAGFVPGDSLTRAVNLVNSGNVALGSVTLNTTVTTPSVLTTDITNGLQLAVKSCSVPWTQAGTATAADLHLRRHRARARLGPGRQQHDAEQPGLAGRGLHRLPDLRRLAAGRPPTTPSRASPPR